MNVIGIDIGFGFTKATNGRRSVIFKSIFGETSDIQYREQLLGGPRSEEYLHVDIGDNGYFVGELAERQSNTRSFTLDQDQFIASFAHIMGCTAMSQLAERNQPVRVITGLPISYFRRHREEISKKLTGRHDVRVYDANGKHNDTVINVTHVRAVPQPFGTLFHHMLNDLAEVSDKRFVQQKIGIIDVGFRTCDFTISDKTRYSERGSQTTDSGIAKAFAVIAAKLREQTGINIELYRLYDAVERGNIKIRGKSIELKPLVDETFRRLASSIASEAERLWVDDWDIDLMLISGGGGAVLAPHLAPLLNGEVLELDPDGDHRLTNVRGYWRYGMNLWGREARRTQTPGS